MRYVPVTSLVWEGQGSINVLLNDANSLHRNENEWAVSSNVVMWSTYNLQKL